MSTAAGGEDSVPGTGSEGGLPGPIGGARITGRLGEGSASIVYRGVQDRLGRMVAVKVLKPSIAPDSPLARRFVRESRILSSLAHENVPQVYGLEATPGAHWLVMELVDGPSLATVVREGWTFGVAASVAVALGIARALEHLHREGVVHRDLKPANVMLGWHGDVKVVDFGLAYRQDDPGDLAASGGTPAYMSPEQVLGDPVDERSDLFSLGVLLYELLTGVRPFTEDPVRTVMQKIRLDRYEPAHRRNPDVPLAIDRVLARCLEKTPAYRYASATLLADDLQEFLHRSAADARTSIADALATHVPDGVARERRRSVVQMTVAAAAAETQPLRRFTWGHAGLALAACTAGLFVDGVPFRDAAARGAAQAGVRAPGAGEVGYLRVVARPWAHIVIDGAEVDTTPTATAFRLTPGTHYVRLTHPSHGTVDRTLRIERGRTAWMDVDMPAGNASPNSPGTGEGMTPPAGTEAPR